MTSRKESPTGNKERRIKGRKLSRLSYIAYALAIVTALLFLETAFSDDPWGEKLQLGEVLVVLFCLSGFGMNVLAIRRGAAAEGALGIISILFVPSVIYLYTMLG